MSYKIFLFFVLLLHYHPFAQSKESKESNQSLANQYEGINDSLHYVYSLAALSDLTTLDSGYVKAALNVSLAAEKMSLLDTSEQILNRVYPMLLVSKDSSMTSIYHLIKAKVLVKRGDLITAEEEILKSIAHALPSFGIELAKAYNTYAAILFRKWDQDNSLEYLFKVSEIYTIDSSIVIEYANSLNNIGNIYQEIGNFDKAMIYHRKASNIYRKNEKWAQQIISYNNLAVSLIKLKQYDSASYYLNRVLKDPHNFSNSHISGKAYLNLGIIFLNQEKYKRSIAYFQKSYSIYENSGDKMGQIICLFSLGEALVSDGQLDEGEEVLIRALMLIKELGVNRYFREVHNLLYELNVERKDYKEALKYHKAYSDFQDSIYDNIESRILDMMELKYNSERKSFKDSLNLVRKNNHIAVAAAKREQELENELILRNLLLTCLVFAAGIIILFFNRYKTQKKNNAIIDATNEELKKTLISKEEKELLLKEIHHRVKNNLQIISSLMRLQSNITAEYRLKSNYQEMQGRINSMALVHEQLYGATDFSVIRVVDYTNILIDRIQKVYSCNGARVNKRIEIEELTIEVLIPLGLLLNELLTNCFKYAILDDSGVIDIQVSTTEEGGRYLLVRDNGPGVDDVENVFNKGTFGGELFKTLIDQLDASYKLTSSGGFKVEVFF